MPKLDPNPWRRGFVTVACAVEVEVEVIVELALLVFEFAPELEGGASLGHT